MCGRYTLRTSAAEVARMFDLQLSLLPAMVARYNIAPTQDAPAIRAAAGGGRELTMLRWGLIPSWADDPAIGSKMINARAETVAEKPSYKKALAQRRCLIIADGYYEWQAVGKRKQPYLFERPDLKSFAFAGLWEHWRRGELVLDTCTIITTAAAERLKAWHERMPVILNERDYEAWLDPELKDAALVTRMLEPRAALVEELTIRPVSTLVNSSAKDLPECAVPIEL